jgi:hypothetical protein
LTARMVRSLSFAFTGFGAFVTIWVLSHQVSQILDCSAHHVSLVTALPQHKFGRKHVQVAEPEIVQVASRRCQIKSSQVQSVTASMKVASYLTDDTVEAGRHNLPQAKISENVSGKP